MRQAWLLALCGCRSILGIEPATGGTGDALALEDAPDDASVPGQICFGRAKVKACVPSQPTDDRVLSKPIDTSAAGTCTLIQPQAAPPSLCVIVARNIVVPTGANVRVVGSWPLVLVGAESVTIDGAIDVASHGGITGAGANTGNCTTPTAGGNGAGGAGGGAGGALGAPGGGGGIGGTGIAGVATPMPSTTVLRGGCAGARGGSSSVGQGGLAGAGGGALYLLSNSAIVINGRINASGAGASAPGIRGGGGGGGAGGMIGIEAPSFMIGSSAEVFAVGGGGASGGGNSIPGNDGPEATGPMATATAPSDGSSGPGGAGSADGSGARGGNGSSTSGGGGGGGSAGIIWAYPTLPGTGAFAPAPRLP